MLDTKRNCVLALQKTKARRFGVVPEHMPVLLVITLRKAQANGKVLQRRLFDGTAIGVTPAAVSAHSWPMYRGTNGKCKGFDQER